MSELRIKVPGDKVDFIKRMVSEEEGPFKTMAQVLAFAAAYGAHKHKPLPLTGVAPDAIRYQVFEREGLEPVIYTLAVGYVKDFSILSNTEKMVEKRIRIFEEFANRGLALLQQQLKGEVDLTNALYLLLGKYRQVEEDEGSVEDLRGVF